MRRVNLSAPVPVVALVSRYLTNKLIGHGPLPRQQVPKDPRPFTTKSVVNVVTSSIIPGFPGLSSSLGYVTHVFLALPPLYSQPASPEGSADKLSRSTCMF